MPRFESWPLRKEQCFLPEIIRDVRFTQICARTTPRVKSVYSSQKSLLRLPTTAFVLLTELLILLHSAQFILLTALRVCLPSALATKIIVAAHGGESRCEERLSGSIIQKATVSSGATTGPMFSSIIPQSLATATALYRKEIQLNLKSFRDRKVRRRQTFRKPVK